MAASRRSWTPPGWRARRQRTAGRDVPGTRRSQPGTVPIEEVDLIEPVRHGPAGLMDLEPDGRQRLGSRQRFGRPDISPSSGGPYSRKGRKLPDGIRRQNGEAWKEVASRIERGRISCHRVTENTEHRRAAWSGFKRQNEDVRERKAGKDRGTSVGNHPHGFPSDLPTRRSANPHRTGANWRSPLVSCLPVFPLSHSAFRSRRCRGDALCSL